MRGSASSWIPGVLFGLLLSSAVPAPANGLGGAGHEACGSCHVFGGAGPGGPLPEARVCLGCHTAAAMQPVPLAGDPWPAHYFPDAVAGSTDCLTCHDPHARDRNGRLREVATPDLLAADLDPVSRLCAQCHEGYVESGGMRYARHPVGIRVPGGVRRTADPSSVPLVDIAGTPDQADDVIACTTCHTVHERRERQLLRWSGREGMIAGCTACHDLAGSGGGRLARSTETEPIWPL